MNDDRYLQGLEISWQNTALASMKLSHMRLMRTSLTRWRKNLYKTKRFKWLTISFFHVQGALLPIY